MTFEKSAIGLRPSRQLASILALLDLEGGRWVMVSESKKGTALVTGASSGIGAVYADRLAKRGYDLILVARDGQRLQRVAESLQAHGNSVRTLVADLTRGEGLARVEATLRDDASITLLLNNAGIGATKPLLDSDIDGLTSMIDLNVVAPTRLAHAAAPAFVARGSGTIINVSSVTALAPELFNGVYAASKAYVLVFTQALQHELEKGGIRVQAVLPGVTSTDFWTTAGLPVSNLPESIVMSPELLVDAALAGLDQGESVTIPSLPDQNEWSTADAARKALGPNLSKSTPAARYGATA